MYLAFWHTPCDDVAREFATPRTRRAKAGFLFGWIVLQSLSFVPIGGCSLKQKDEGDEICALYSETHQFLQWIGLKLMLKSHQKEEDVKQSEN